MFAVVTNARGQQRKVKNLGWLLSHAAKVTRIEAKLVVGQPSMADLFASLQDGSIYFVRFQSRTVLGEWLDRPSLRDLPLRWFGTDTVCGPNLA